MLAFGIVGIAMLYLFYQSTPKEKTAYKESGALERALALTTGVETRFNPALTAPEQRALLSVHGSFQAQSLAEEAQRLAQSRQFSSSAGVQSPY